MGQFIALPRRSDESMSLPPTPTPPHTALMRSTSLSGYLELVRSLGRDPGVFLRAVGLRAEQLLNPEALLPRDAGRELLEITARATRLEDFALRLASQRRLSALGPISLVLKEESTPGHALNTLSRYLKLVNPSLILHIEETGDSVVIREDLLPSPGLSMRQSVELAVGGLYRMLSELIGPHWEPREVYLTHPPPADPSAHRAFFGRNVKFNQNFNGLVCLKSDLSRPRESSDAVAAGFARRYLESALQPGPANAQVVCYQIVRALLPSGDCTASEVARLMKIDRRTLHRQLQKQGLSFSRVLDQVRIDLVQLHLLESDLALGEIAGLLGFAQASALSHWFRMHFGCPASAWGRRAGAGRPPE